MKDVITQTVLSKAEKVNASALSHLIKKGWIDEENKANIDSFFAQKIPKVLSDEISKELHEILGLNLSL